MTYVFNEARRQELSRHWAAMRVTRKASQITSDASKLAGKRDMYRIIEQKIGVPWVFVAVVDSREGGMSVLGKTHLHNGDPLTAYTKHVPANRPAVGHGPPFEWQESAIDALRMKKLDQIHNWTVERMLHELEPYNGLGYYNKGIPSPYIWSCTNQYDPPAGPGGKYVADHVFDKNAVDSQLGCAPLLAQLMKVGEVVPSEAQSPTTTPVSDTVKKSGGAIGKAATGTVVVATTAAASGVPIGQIVGGVLVIIAVVAIGIVIWHQRRK